MSTFAAELERVGPGLVEIIVPFAAGLTQQDGFFHAGVVIAAMDSACGYAAFTLMERDVRVLTVESSRSIFSRSRAASGCSRGGRSSGPVARSRSAGGRLCRDGRGGTPGGDDPHDDDRARRGVALVEPERDDRTVAQAQAGSGPSPRSKRSSATRTAIRRMEPREAPGRCCCLTPIPVTAPARPVCSATGSAAVLKVDREPRPASVLPRCADPTVREPEGVNSAGLTGRAGAPIGGQSAGVAPERPPQPSTSGASGGVR